MYMRVSLHDVSPFKEHCNGKPQKCPLRAFGTCIAPRVQRLKNLSSVKNCLIIGNGQRSRCFISFVVVAQGM